VIDCRFSLDAVNLKLREKRHKQASHMHLTSYEEVRWGQEE